MTDPGISLKVGARSDVGRVRKGNEDSYTVTAPLFAVADGMGGHLGGEVASKLALEVLAGGEGSLEELVRAANEAIFRRAAKDPSLSGMGTTLTAFRQDGDVLRLAHVGDSRAYLLRDATIQRLTKDHTVVERLVDEGRLTAEEAEIHPQRSILTRALGVDDDLQVDQGAIEPHAGDRLLLCSDGLTGMIGEPEIARILAENADPQSAADALVEAANQAGGQDNITAVVIDVEGGAGDGPAGAARDATAPQAATRPTAPSRQRPMPSAGRIARPERPGVGRRVAWAIAVLVVVVVALWAVKALWVDNQFFVGDSGGHVAVFRGIPAEPLGVDLATAIKEFPELRTAEVAQLPEYRTLTEGITAGSEEEARSIVEQMRAALDAAQQAGGGAPADGSAQGS